MEKIIVDRIRPFHFPKEIENLYGEFLIRQQNEVAAKILEFTLNDLMFFTQYAGNDDCLKASVFQQMTSNRGYVPLDAYCARAIYEGREMLSDLMTLWFNNQYYAGNKNARTIMFLGNIIARDDTDVNHFVFFKSIPHSDNVEFLPYEDDPAFSGVEDSIIVFKPEFIKRII